MNPGDPETDGAAACGESGDPIIGGLEWRAWSQTPAGRYLLAWEQQQCDAAVADVFGYVALQCGVPELDALAANRMPTRVIAVLGADTACEQGERSLVRVASYEDLPFDAQSLDLVVLAHVLECAADPHQILREVDRVLRPEGRLVVIGFNPVSFWGARHLAARTLSRPCPPCTGPFIAVQRLRDWLMLLSYGIERGRYGCYRPPCRTQRWLDRWAFMEKAGDRWWPILGSVYTISAVKRVRGMRLIGPAWKKPVAAKGAVPAASQFSHLPASGQGPEPAQVTRSGTSSSRVSDGDQR
jgi:SAM-dependent methyltransferase